MILLTRRLPRTATVLGMAALLQAGCGRTDQSSATNGSAPPPTPASSQTVELTGCLSRGTIPGSFVLDTNGSENRSGPVGTSGSPTDRDADASAGARYTVVSLEGKNLGAYVGKRVSVSGRYAANTTTGDGAPGTPGAGGSDPGTEDHGRTPLPATRTDQPGGTAASGATAVQRDVSGIPVRQVNAESVRVVQDSCGAGKGQETPERR